ncbi:MAG TPA: hypothetical protein VJO52_06015 [Gemmatimonadaceae bacterium]|nr:hypothetical protein [Gemmatimonadaceae bacterium]
MRSPLLVVCGVLLPAAAIAALTACIFRGVNVASIARTDSTTVLSPVKLHLQDGATVVFPHGIRISGDTVRGAGRHYSIIDSLASNGAEIVTIPLDSIVAMESFTNYVDGTKSAVMTTLAVAGAVLGTAGLSAAVFGSCPTIYSDSAGVPALEAEGFSYSISPLLERRDLHRLRAQPDVDGTLSLDVRNEALETHYINQLELLGVTHANAEFVLPDAEERPLAVGAIVPLTRAVDRAGNDVTKALADDDSLVFHSDPKTLAGVTAADFDDWIDVTIPVPHGADSLVLLFHLRNSLLNTVLLYDEMLRPQGARAVDFEGRDLNTIADMVALGRWYGSRMGLHISVRRGGQGEEVAYVPDAGPIAWRDVASVIPATADDTLHVRLSFVADEWRLGKVAVATRFRRPAPQRFAPMMVAANGVADTDALRSVSGLDARYLETTPGQQLTLRFSTGAGPRDSVRTFLLATEGYYTEWIRGGWVRQAKGAAPRPFIASDSTLAETVRHWATVGPAFESAFAHRIPVRHLP